MGKTQMIMSTLALALTGCATMNAEPDIFRMSEVCQTPGVAGTASVVRVYGGKKGDGLTAGQSLAPDEAGGFVIGGVTQGLGAYAGNTDLLLTKIGSSGQIRWVRTFGGPQMDIGTAFIRTADGGHLQAGDSYGHLHTGMAYVVAGSDQRRLLLVKTDAGGKFQWHKLYSAKVAGDFRISNLRSVLQTTDGGFVISGSTAMNPTGPTGPKRVLYSDVMLAKTDGSGVFEWARSYGAGGPDEAFSLVNTADGGYLLAGGYTVTPGTRRADVLLLKVDAGGSLEWTKTFGGSGFNVAQSVVQTTDGGYAVAARSDGFGAGDTDILLIKTDDKGEHRWARTFGGVKREEPTMLLETSDGGLLITGHATSFGDPKTDAVILKTDASGNLEWAKTFGGPGLDVAYSVADAAQETFTVAGTTESYGAGKEDIFLLRLSSNSQPGTCLRDIAPTQTTPNLEIAVPTLNVADLELEYQRDSLRKQQSALFE